MKKINRSAEKKNKTDYSWIVLIFVITLCISALMSFIFSRALNDASIGVSYLILVFIILIGVFFDIVGVAVTSATEKPFHSMASRKVPGAMDALRLIRKAGRVSSFCNDVIGDICGVISGAAAAVIAVRAAAGHGSDVQMAFELITSALVAAFTIGGKAMGKSFAISESTAIVHFAGKVIYYLKKIPTVFRKK